MHSPSVSCIFTGAGANECVGERYVVQADLRSIREEGEKLGFREREGEGRGHMEFEREKQIDFEEDARKEWYLYVQSMQLLLRLNLSDLCGESGSSSRPDFEVAHDYSDGKVPIGMGCMVVGSKIYMVGGENTKEGSMLLEQDEKNWLNSDNVYAFDPTKSEEDRLVLVRDGAVPSLNAPKTCPLVVTLEGKFYLLSTKPFLDRLTGTVAIFEGFDPTLPIPLWKILPAYPPYTLLDYPSYHRTTYPTSADDYFAWGHKFVSAPPDYFIFDAKDEKWTNGHWLLRQFADKSAPYPYGVAIEFKGILFAVSNDIKAVVAYDLDAGGHLNAHWVLDELSEVFQGPPSLYPSQGGFLTHLGGGRMCVLFNGMNEGIRWTIRVEVFQVSITTVGDRPVVRRGSLHSYDLGSWEDYNPMIYSVFVCDHSNKSDIEADASSGSYSCEDLKKRAEHAVEYVKGDSKKQKTTLPE